MPLVQHPDKGLLDCYKARDYVLLQFIADADTWIQDVMRSFSHGASPAKCILSFRHGACPSNRGHSSVCPGKKDIKEHCAYRAIIDMPHDLHALW